MYVSQYFIDTVQANSKDLKTVENLATGIM